MKATTSKGPIVANKKLLEKIAYMALEYEQNLCREANEAETEEEAEILYKLADEYREFYFSLIKNFK